MNECICNSCKHLKQQLGTESSDNDYACKYGYPSDSCKECDGEECNVEECSHYMEDKEDGPIKTVHCIGCGKELEQAYEDEADGEVYCISCYLNLKDS
jgi:hypothetical protein